MNYLQQLADDIKTEIPADSLPDRNVSELLLIYAVLLEARGTAVTNEDVHNAWVAWMTHDEPDHDSLVPYADLSSDVRQEDSVFTQAIRTVANRRTS